MRCHQLKGHNVTLWKLLKNEKKLGQIQPVFSHSIHQPTSISSPSFQCILGGNTSIQPCLTSPAHFQCTLSCMSECQWPAGWHKLSRRQMPKPVTRPSLQVFHPIYLSLLPMTGHVEMDTETLLHIDSGNCNSRARRGLSPACSFHFLYVRERETAETELETTCPDRSLYSVLTHSPSARVILSDSKCLLRQQGARAVKEKGQSRQRFDQTLILKVYMWTFQHFPHQCQEKKKKKMEEAAGTDRL